MLVIEIEAIEEQIDELEAQIDDIEEELDESVQNIEEQIDDLEDRLRRQYGEDEITDIEDQIDELENERDDITEEFEDRIAEIQEEIEELQKLLPSSEIFIGDVHTSIAVIRTNGEIFAGKKVLTIDTEGGEWVKIGWGTYIKGVSSVIEVVELRNENTGREIHVEGRYVGFAIPIAKGKFVLREPKS